MKLKLTLGLTILCLATALHAGGLVILEGSDAQTFHSSQPYSDNFLTGFQSFSTAPLLPVLAVGSQPVGAPPAGLVFMSDLSTVTLADLLGSYSALYIGSPGTCCDENDAVIAGHEADITAFVAAGRGLTVEDYQGGAAFNSILGWAVDPSNVYGFNTVGGGSICFDGNTWTAGGQAFGLGPDGGAVPNLGCFGHQAYDQNYFALHGFTTQLVKAAPGAVPNADAYVVITNGGGGLAEASGVPEPGTFALLGAGLVALAAGRRRLVSRRR